MIKDIYGNTRFLGIYRGVVYDVKDPDNKNRIRVRVPQILANNPTQWAYPFNLHAATPEVGDGVWVQFEGGDPMFPIWNGLFKGASTSSTTTTSSNPAILDGGSA